MVYHKTPRMFHLQSLVHHISLHLLTKTNSMHSYRLSFRKSPHQCLNNIVLRIGHSALRPDKKMGIAVSRQEHCSVFFPNKMSWRLHVQVLKLRPFRELPFVFQPRRLVAKECIMQHEPSKRDSLCCAGTGRMTDGNILTLQCIKKIWWASDGLQALCALRNSFCSF